MEVILENGIEGMIENAGRMSDGIIVGAGWEGRKTGEWKGEGQGRILKGNESHKGMADERIGKLKNGSKRTVPIDPVPIAPLEKE